VGHDKQFVDGMKLREIPDPRPASHEMPPAPVGKDPGDEVFPVGRVVQLFVFFHRQKGEPAEKGVGK
jgi:hypothetical protein